MKVFPLTGSKIVDLVILAIIGYIIYGIIAFGIPSDPVAPADRQVEDTYEFDVMDLF